jgi:hypothetical protein
MLQLPLVGKIILNVLEIVSPDIFDDISQFIILNIQLWSRVLDRWKPTVCTQNNPSPLNPQSKVYASSHQTPTCGTPPAAHPS